MMFKLIFLLSTILWSIATGFREGCMWYNDYRKRLPLDYHFWRNVEYLSVGLMILTYQGFLIFALGSWMFGEFLIYERCLQYIQYGDFYVEQSPYKILGIEIPIKNIHYNLIAFIGIILIIISIV